jgi:RimJ/RimL family protein N-acetyltransferase
MKNNDIIDTERLTLRLIEPGDFDALMTYMTDRNTKKYTVAEPDTAKSLREFIKNVMENENIYEFAVIRKDDGMVIGNVGLYNTDKINDSQIAWIFSKQSQGKGFAFEAAKAVESYAFNSLKLHRLTAYCDAENAPSFRLMEKLGMRREGLFVKARLSNSILGHAYRDEIAYAILAEEFFAAAR